MKASKANQASGCIPAIAQARIMLREASRTGAGGRRFL
jgi:hypothetical protein